MQKLKDVWNKIPANAKPKILVLCITAVIVLMGIVFYLGKEVQKPEKKAESNIVDHDLDREQIKQGLLAAANKREEEVNEKLKAQNKIIADMSKAIEELKKMPRETATGPQRTMNKKKTGNPRAANQLQLPPPPVPKNSYPGQGPKVPAPPDPHEGKREVVGGIKVVSNSEFTKLIEKAKGQKKEDGKTIFLPPSFMPGRLLAGLTAPTVTGKKDEPLPVFILIEKPAILPNNLRANTKGCFFQGEGEGRLRDHRIHVRLNSMACIRNDGQAVFEEPVEGYLVDGNDGKIGISGHVVAKMGTHIARAAWAGLIGGVGEGVKLSTQDLNFGNNGTVQSIFSSTDTDNIVKYSVGSGISEGAKALQDFYLKLAEETLPVIESGATQKVTVVIKKGVTIKIKDWKKDL